ncbi:hypothetical protein D3C76_1096370 [compost metagenome]
MPAVLVAVDRAVRALVNLHQARRLGMSGYHRVIFKVAEAARKSHMFGACDLLLAYKKHTMLNQGLTDGCEQTIVMHRVT